MDGLYTFLIFVCSLTLILDISLAITFDVTKFGARGNGNTDDSKAFISAWNKACSTRNSTMVVPRGKIYLLRPLLFHGPCKGPFTNVKIDGTLVAPKTPSQWSGCTDSTWIVFSNVNFLRVYGTGKIDGQGSVWWRNVKNKHVYEIDEDENTYNGIGSIKGSVCTRPTALRFINCNNLKLRRLTHTNPPSRHISIFKCNHVEISNLKIIAPGESPNTDGIGISYSNNVNILNSIISTGDDCIAISTGSSNIFVKEVHCGPGHGISVGSLGEGSSYATVNGVYVKSCTLTGTQNGLRIKTWMGGNGYARNITFDDIQLNRVQNGIIIDQHYCNGGHNCAQKSSGVQVSDVKYINVRGTSSLKQAILIDCSKSINCKRIILDHVNIRTLYAKEVAYATCNNAQVSSRTVSPIVYCKAK